MRNWRNNQKEARQTVQVYKSTLSLLITVFACDISKPRVQTVYLRLARIGGGHHEAFFTCAVRHMYETIKVWLPDKERTDLNRSFVRISWTEVR